jgi:hypothetical protein
VISAVDPDLVKNVLTAGSFLPLVVALVLFKFAVSAVVRSLLIVVAIVLGVVVFTQRAAVDECVDSFDREGASLEASCSILGFDFDFEI